MVLFPTQELGKFTGVVKTRNAGISRNMEEYAGISRNMPEYHGIWRNITTFCRNIPGHHDIFRWLACDCLLINIDV